ncbi:uncharacterized protein C8R40DRAFT_1022310, partial [Lentinula edodes]|uniref:uncharacterized protein n=1 Tax=Lentinula edodes TaxID=5353 RepID=UPI001E8E4062
LSSDQGIEYTFLSDFDLLCDAWQDIHCESWAQPAACLALDQYYNLVHAKEEIMRLNKEI